MHRTGSRAGPAHHRPEAPALTSARAACTADPAPAAAANPAPMPSRRGPGRLCQPERVDGRAGATPLLDPRSPAAKAPPEAKPDPRARSPNQIGPPRRSLTSRASGAPAPLGERAARWPRLVGPPRRSPNLDGESSPEPAEIDPHARRRARRCANGALAPRDWPDAPRAQRRRRGRRTTCAGARLDGAAGGALRPPPNRAQLPRGRRPEAAPERAARPTNPAGPKRRSLTRGRRRPRPPDERAALRPNLVGPQRRSLDPARPGSAAHPQQSVLERDVTAPPEAIFTPTNRATNRTRRTGTAYRAAALARSRFERSAGQVPFGLTLVRSD
jgi:hypothetical protein